MNKQPILQKTTAAALTGLIILAAFTRYVAMADTEIIAAKILTATNSCVGKYYAYVKMTNSAGSIWIKPPTNIVVSSGTLTDISGFPAPYSSYATVLPFGSSSYLCQSNSVTFPATNTLTYQLMVVVTSPTPPPTNGQPLTLQIQWQ